MTLLSSLLQSLLSACEEGMGRHSIVNMVFFISKWHIRLQQIGHMESQETVPIFMWKVSVYYPFNGKAAMKWGLPMLKCIWHEKYFLLIRKEFQNTEIYWNIFFRFRDIDIFSIMQIRSVMTSYCLQLEIVKYWINNISRNIKAVIQRVLLVLTPINRLCGVDGSWFKTKTGNFSFIKTAPVAKLLSWQQH